MKTKTMPDKVDEILYRQKERELEEQELEQSLTEGTKPEWISNRGVVLFNKLSQSKDQRERDIIQGQLKLLILGNELPEPVSRNVLSRTLR